MEALFLSHFFPHLKPLYWAYTGVLWWATMYLSHHYLIDLTGGACLSVVVFYLFMPEQFKDSDQIVDKSEYELVNGTSGDRQADLDLDEEIRKLEENEDEDDDARLEGDEEQRMEGAATRQKQKRSVSWGETKVMGEE